MKSTGIVRKVDELGRIVIPMELRRTIDIHTGDPIAIFVDGDSIILQKYEPGCFMCDQVENLQNFKGKLLCNNCIKEMLSLVG